MNETIGCGRGRVDDRKKKRLGGGDVMMEIDLCFSDGDTSSSVSLCKHSFCSRRRRGVGMLVSFLSFFLGLSVDPSFCSFVPFICQERHE